METLENLLFQRIRRARRISARDVVDLCCFYGAELEIAMATLDRPNRVVRYAVPEGLHGMAFYVVEDLLTGASHVVFARARFCDCEKNDCRHRIAVRLLEALEIPVREVVDRGAWEDVLMSRIEAYCA